MKIFFRAFLFCFLAFWNCGVYSFSVIAHRGNSSEAPENTLAAFRQAIDLQVDFIEFDVHLSKEGVPVVIHDAILGRTTNYHSFESVSGLGVKDLQSLDAGSWFHFIYSREAVPTLEQVLDLPLGSTGIMIEIKEESAPAPLLANAVAELLEKKHPDYPVVVASFSSPVLRLIKERLPKQKILALFSDLPELWEHMENDPELLGCSFAIIDKINVPFWQSTGKQVWVWTVDSPEDQEKVIGAGADGLISNRPRQLITRRLAGAVP